MSSFTKKHSAIVKSGLANMCAIYDEVVKKHTKIPKTGSELYEMLCVEIFGEDEPQSASEYNQKQSEQLPVVRAVENKEVSEKINMPCSPDNASEQKNEKMFP